MREPDNKSRRGQNVESFDARPQPAQHSGPGVAPRMNFLTRLIGYSVLLLLAFLAAALGAQGWLRQQTQRLRTEVDVIPPIRAA